MKRKWLIIGLVCAACAALSIGLVSACGQIARWKEAGELEQAHITYSHGACAGRSCPTYSVEIFGDGRVTYVGIANVTTRGTWSYRVSRKAVQPWLKDFIISSFWSHERSALAAPGDGACRVTMRYQNVAHSNGCYNHVGEDGLTLESASLASDIVQMEAILHIDAFTLGNANMLAKQTPKGIEYVRRLH